ncbi:MAG: formylglycine-generating enzyme family protein [Fibromonadales bacterium]|nr:formylglycine-generating enzyme family protein [Fibromonadales bacterium]
MAKWLMLFGLLFIACGEVGGALKPGESGGNQDSSSSNAVSSSSLECLSMDYINWQAAPGNSYIHAGLNGSLRIIMDPFYISVFLIKQGQYREIMGENPSKGVKNDTLPVEGVSWFKAEEFCKKLSVRMCLEPNAIKMPTEAQWEYSAVADPPVMQRYNEYWEWTNDCFDSKFPWTEYDPSGPPNCPLNFEKVRKGLNNLYNVRRSTDPNLDNISGSYIGFRVAVKNSFLN